MQKATWDDDPGRKVFTAPAALSLMVFFALCCQCASTLAVIRRETRSWRWPAFTFTYMTVLAYVGGPGGIPDRQALSVSETNPKRERGISMVWQLSVVGLIVVAAGAYLARRAWRTWGRKASGCGGCGSG